jgi:hypothetical protein
MSKYRKAVFPHYRGLGEESIRELITDLVKEIPDGVDVSVLGPDTEPGPEVSAPFFEVQSPNQELLVGYLEGRIPFSVHVQHAYLEETNAESPNDLLFRKYFLEGNTRLVDLLIRSLEQYPTDPSLLNDLSVLHESAGILEKVVEGYIRACQLETDPYAFASLAEAFYYNTLPDGYDAWYELRRIVSGNLEKTAVIEFLEARHLPGKHPKEPIFQ